MPGGRPESGPPARSPGSASVLFVLVLFFMLAAVSHFGQVGRGAAAVAWGCSLVAPVGACTCSALWCLTERSGHLCRELTGHCGGRLTGGVTAVPE